MHALGATVRLEDGSLASVPAGELAANRPAFVGSAQRREPLEFAVEETERRRIAYLRRETKPEPAGTPRLVDPVFEDRINSYLKQTEDWAPPDRPPPAERHFIRKKRRAAFFEARTKPT